jgi:hypothetical protein
MDGRGFLVGLKRKLRGGMPPPYLLPSANVLYLHIDKVAKYIGATIAMEMVIMLRKNPY